MVQYVPDLVAWETYRLIVVGELPDSSLVSERLVGHHWVDGIVCHRLLYNKVKGGYILQ